MTTTLDLIIEGGTVIDGTGAPRRRLDVGIAGDRIIRLGDLSGVPAARRFDASGHIVAPGFIDVHTHDDRLLLDAPEGPHPKLSQGVTHRDDALGIGQRRADRDHFGGVRRPGRRVIKPGGQTVTGRLPWDRPWTMSPGHHRTVQSSPAAAWLTMRCKGSRPGRPTASCRQLRSWPAFPRIARDWPCRPACGGTVRSRCRAPGRSAALRSMRRRWRRPHPGYESPKLSYRQAPVPSRSSGAGGVPADCSGARLIPQLPVMTVECPTRQAALTAGPDASRSSR